jgi:beta-lactamase regulating signal transducer with metallopeptidase domain
MLTIRHTLELPLIEALGWALVHFVWQAALLALLLALLLIPLRRVSARVRYAVQCAVFAAMPACPLVTWCWIASSQTAKPATMAAVTDPVVQEAPPVDVAPILVAPAPIANDRDVRPALLEPAPLAEPSVTRFVPWTERLHRRLTPALPWLVGAWLLGVVVLSLRLLVGWRVVQRLKRLAVSPVAEVWQSKLKDLAARLRILRPVKLVESALIEVPTVIGWFRPMILLPISLLTRLTPQQLEAILAHELAHIHRHDYLVNLIQTAIETLLFYHPAVWWISGLIRAEREHCCDDLALSLCNNAVTYVTALAAMEELRASPTLTVAATGGSLLSRIRRIAVGPGNVSYRSTRWGASLIALMVIGSLGLTTYFALHANDDSKPTVDQTTTTPPNDTITDVPSDKPSPAPEWGNRVDGLRARIVSVLSSMTEDAIDSPQRVTKFAKAKDIAFVFELENVSDKPIKLVDVFHNDTNGEPNVDAAWTSQYVFSIDLFDGEGRLIEQPEIEVDDVIFFLPSARVAILEPGMTQKFMIKTDSWLATFKPQIQPGKYRVAVRYHWLSTPNATKTIVKNSPLLEVPAINVASASVAVEVEGKRRQADLIWGKANNGLRAAVSIEPPQATYAHDQVHGVRLHLQNVGTQPLKLVSNLYMPDAQTTYSNDKGKRMKLDDSFVGGRMGTSLRGLVTLKPQQIVVINLSSVGLAATKKQAKQFDEQMVRKLIAPSGKYSVQSVASFKNNVLNARRVDGQELVEVKDAWIGDLKTGITPFTIGTAPELGLDLLKELLKELLKPYPKLHGLSYDMTEPKFLKIVNQQQLKARKTVEGEDVTHHIDLGDEHTLIVTFDKDGKCIGIQRESSKFEPIQGEVIDAVTGKPITGATVRYRIFEKLPFDPRGKDKPLAELVFRNVGRYKFELPDTVNVQTNLFVERFAEHPDYQSMGAIGQGFYFLPKAASSHARDSIRQVKMVPGKVVTGLVLDLDGQPARGIAVTSGRYRDGWQNGCEHKTTTDANGRYRLVVPNNDARGRLYVIPSHAAAVSRAITEEYGEQQVFQLRPGTRLYGRVTDANGKGVAGVALRADGSDRVPWRYTMTDADGRYSFPPIQYGTYVVDLYDEGRFRELPKNGVRLPDVFLPQVVELPKTAPTEQQLDFRPTESVRMTARFTTSDNQPMSDRSLTISGVANKVPWWGRLREASNQPGIYELRVPRGFSGRFNENADNGGFLRITRETIDGKSVPEQHVTDFDKDGISFHVVRMKPSSVTLRPTFDGKPIKPNWPRNYPQFANADDAQKLGARLPSSQSRMTEESGIWFDAHPDIDLVLKLEEQGFKPWQKTFRIPEGVDQVIEVPLQETVREAGRKRQTAATNASHNAATPLDQSLADIVREFNAKNKELEQGLNQPALTEDEVITVLKQDEWKPEDTPLNEKEIAVFKAVAGLRRLPKGSSLQVITERRTETFSYRKLWQVRLMLPAIGHDGFVGLTIRDTEIVEEKIDPQQVAWGKPDARGLSLGVYLSPKKEKYAIGERVKLRLFVRNEGKQAVDNLTFYNVSWPNPKDFTVTDQTGAVVAVGNVHDEQWGLQWVAGATAGRLATGDAHTFNVPFELAIGGEAPSKLVGRIIEARPGQTLSLRVREHNGNDNNRKEGEPKPETGSIVVSVVE